MEVGRSRQGRRWRRRQEGGYRGDSGREESAPRFGGDWCTKLVEKCRRSGGAVALCDSMLFVSGGLSVAGSGGASDVSARTKEG